MNIINEYSIKSVKGDDGSIHHYYEGHGTKFNQSETGDPVEEIIKKTHEQRLKKNRKSRIKFLDKTIEEN